MTQIIELRFDPDQERDRHGRWADEGGGSDASDSLRVTKRQAGKHAAPVRRARVQGGENGMGGTGSVRTDIQRAIHAVNADGVSGRAYERIMEARAKKFDLRPMVVTSRDLSTVTGHGGRVGGFYDPSSREITIDGEAVSQISNLQDVEDPPNVSANLTMDMTERVKFIYTHELGHALVDAFPRGDTMGPARGAFQAFKDAQERAFSEFDRSPQAGDPIERGSAPDRIVDAITPFTMYAQVNEEEFFAEAFTLYAHRPALLQEHHPEVFAMVEKALLRVGVLEDTRPNAPPRIQLAFDPSQPRDEDGKWTDGGGSWSAKSVPPNVVKRVRERATADVIVKSILAGTGKPAYEVASDVERAVADHLNVPEEHRASFAQWLNRNSADTEAAMRQYRGPLPKGAEKEAEDFGYLKGANVAAGASEERVASLLEEREELWKEHFLDELQADELRFGFSDFGITGEELDAYHEGNESSFMNTMRGRVKEIRARADAAVPLTELVDYIDVPGTSDLESQSADAVKPERFGFKLYGATDPAMDAAAGLAVAQGHSVVADGDTGDGMRAIRPLDPVKVVADFTGGWERCEAIRRGTDAAAVADRATLTTKIEEAEKLTPDGVTTWRGMHNVPAASMKTLLEKSEIEWSAPSSTTLSLRVAIKYAENKFADPRMQATDRKVSANRVIFEIYNAKGLVPFATSRHTDEAEMIVRGGSRLKVTGRSRLNGHDGPILVVRGEFVLATGAASAQQALGMFSAQVLAAQLETHRALRFVDAFAHAEGDRVVITPGPVMLSASGATLRLTQPREDALDALVKRATTAAADALLPFVGQLMGELSRPEIDTREEIEHAISGVEAKLGDWLAEHPTLAQVILGTRMRAHAAGLLSTDVRLDAAHEARILLEDFPDGARDWRDAMLNPEGAGQDDFFARPRESAVDAFTSRKVIPRSVFDLLIAQEKIQAFTMARAATQRVLDTAHASLAEAIEEGLSIDHFVELLEDNMALRGLAMGPELTPWYLETVFRTNVLSAYADGRKAIFLTVADERPLWVWRATHDDRVRPEHAAMHGLAMRHDDSMWDLIGPPASYGCRCAVVAMAAADVDEDHVIDGTDERVVALASSGFAAEEFAFGISGGALLLWDSNQPRDDDGRWSDDGGSSRATYQEAQRSAGRADVEADRESLMQAPLSGLGGMLARTRGDATGAKQEAAHEAMRELYKQRVKAEGEPTLRSEVRRMQWDAASTPAEKQDVIQGALHDPSGNGLKELAAEKLKGGIGSFTEAVNAYTGPVPPEVLERARAYASDENRTKVLQRVPISRLEKMGQTGLDRSGVMGWAGSTDPAFGMAAAAAVIKEENAKAASAEVERRTKLPGDLEAIEPSLRVPEFREAVKSSILTGLSMRTLFDYGLEASMADEEIQENIKGALAEIRPAWAETEGAVDKLVEVLNENDEGDSLQAWVDEAVSEWDGDVPPIWIRDAETAGRDSAERDADSVEVEDLDSAWPSDEQAKDYTEGGFGGFVTRTERDAFYVAYVEAFSARLEQRLANGEGSEENENGPERHYSMPSDEIESMTDGDAFGTRVIGTSGSGEVNLAVYRKANNEPMGTLSVTLKQDGAGPFARDPSFFLLEEKQNQGAAQDILRHAFSSMKEKGFSRVDTQAVQIGRYAWATMGFQWDNDAASYVRTYLADALEEAGAPYPREQLKAYVNAIANKPDVVAAINFNGGKQGKAFILDGDFPSWTGTLPLDGERWKIARERLWIPEGGLKKMPKAEKQAPKLSAHALAVDGTKRGSKPKGDPQAWMEEWADSAQPPFDLAKSMADALGPNAAKTLTPNVAAPSIKKP